MYILSSYPLKWKLCGDPISTGFEFIFKSHYIQGVQTIYDSSSKCSTPKYTRWMSSSRYRLEFILTPRILDVVIPRMFHHLHQVKDCYTDVCKQSYMNKTFHAKQQTGLNYANSPHHDQSHNLHPLNYKLLYGIHIARLVVSSSWNALQNIVQYVTGTNFLDAISDNKIIINSTSLILSRRCVVISEFSGCTSGSIFSLSWSCSTLRALLCSSSLRYT